ncbi:MAG: hypothetical protein MAG795_00983 [Candidatus Woesearchaeota archaeon]|nr:hypothetical protein [Candidatus Woesearchaeota archaeon]
MRKQTKVWIIFAFALFIRLYLCFQTPHFSDGTSYFNQRQIESIKSTGIPIYSDPLSYSGRFYIFLPFFHYLVAFFALILPLGLAVKLVPNILFCALILINYKIAQKITKKHNISLVVALISAFLPVLYKDLNTLSVYSLVVPLTFALLYYFMKITQDKKYILNFLILLIILAASHQLIILPLLSFLVYLFFVWLEGLRYRRIELELITFSCFFILWLIFIIFKNAFLAYGPNLIHQNIPSVLISKYFLEFNLLDSIFTIGIVPFCAGIYVIYRHLLREKNRDIYLIISFAITIFSLIWLRLIRMQIGLVYFSIILTLLSAKAFEQLSVYFNKTKFTKYKKWINLVLILVFIITAFVPSILYAASNVSDSFTQEEIEAFNWIKNNTPQDSVVLATPKEGHLITGIAKRKNVIDENFLLQPDINQIYSDTNSMYTTIFQTEAIRLLNKYEVDYILFSQRAKAQYDINKIQYLGERCFTQRYNKTIIIYSVDCTIKEANEN